MHVAVIVQPQDDRRIGFLNEFHTARWALRPRVGESFRKRGRDNLVTFSCIFLARPEIGIHTTVHLLRSQIVSQSVFISFDSGI